MQNSPIQNSPKNHIMKEKNSPVQNSPLLYELRPIGSTHRVTSDKVHRLLFKISFFRLDRFKQLLSLISILILLLYLLTSVDQVYTGLCELVPE